MLTEPEVRAMWARRRWAVFPAMFGAGGAVLLYFAGVGSIVEPLSSLAGSRFGDAARELTPIVLILPAFAVFLLPSCLAARYAERFKTLCPLCCVEITSRSERAIATRCCPSCGARILEGGRAHSPAVYERYQALRTRQFLRRWLWGFPAVGGLAIAWRMIDHLAFQDCPQCLLMAPLIAAATAGWAWLRTFDRRYLPQVLASLVLLGFGVVLFWQTL